jgi:hypothetical protein
MGADMAKTAVPRVWARRPLQYEELVLDRGQVFTLRGRRNDDKLLRLGYVAELERGMVPVTCAECGAEFLGESERRAHGDRRHRAVPLTPAEEDALADREERLLNQIAPLYVGGNVPEIRTSG